MKDNERAFIKAKLALDAGESSHEVKLDAKGVLRVFHDWKVWLAGLMYFFLLFCENSYFIPHFPVL